MGQYYHDLVKGHLVKMLTKGDLITENILFDLEERDLIITMSLEYGYIPVFSESHSGYVSFCAIKRFLPS